MNGAWESRKGTLTMENDEKKQTILIVDDEPIVGKTVGKAMEQITDDVVIVQSGAAAVEVCRSRSFDVVVSDMKMPGMDGVELLRLLAHD